MSELSHRLSQHCERLPGVLIGSDAWREACRAMLADEAPGFALNDPGRIDVAPGPAGCLTLSLQRDLTTEVDGPGRYAYLEVDVRVEGAAAWSATVPESAVIVAARWWTM